MGYSADDARHDETFQRGYAAGIARERERCAKIAEAVNSGRGNEKLIAEAIRRGE
jgi:hypothetical protein